MKYIARTIGIIALILAVVPVFAQGFEPAPVPIDGGASILAAAGVAYGIKKYRDHKKQQAE